MARKSIEATKDYNRKYWAEHKEEINAKRRTQQTTAERSAYHLKWQQAHRDRYNAYQREWRRRKKEEQKALDKNKQV